MEGTGETDSAAEEQGFEPSVPLKGETVVDPITQPTATAYFACAALSMECFMLRKIGASLSAIPADIDNGSEWCHRQEAYFSIENTGGHCQVEAL